ncbi:MAG: peptidylprolyl isomerase [Alphaproteobacteria bacterium]|nr:MAG: peptidylprolyl isomerase [Alphaproteobacteria bacterium]
MRKINKYLCIIGLMLLPMNAGAADLSLLDQENLMMLELRTGVVAIEMRPDKAPNTVARLKELIRAGFYDGLKFHRVIDGFMAQTGDPNGDGTGGSGQSLKNEFNSMRLIRGRAVMAREADDIDSADSQFFIMLNTRRLPAQYTAWGRVVDGMQHVDQITVGDESQNGAVRFPDSIVRVWIAADRPQ